MSAKLMLFLLAEYALFNLLFVVLAGCCFIVSFCFCCLTFMFFVWLKKASFEDAMVVYIVRGYRLFKRCFPAFL